MVAVDIVNLALSYLGDTATVASIDPPEGSAQAQHAARFYPVALGMMLEMHEWNFITKRVQLASLSVDVTAPWAYAYAYPSDANSILSILPLEMYADAYSSVPQFPYYPGTSTLSGIDFALFNSWAYGFENDCIRNFQVEVNAKGQQVILSNIGSAVARYTINSAQPGNFPLLFTDALAHLLASMLAGPLLKGEMGAQMAVEQKKLAAVGAAQAMGQDANQKHETPRPQPVWIRDR